MFSALKKLTNRNEGGQPPGPQNARGNISPGGVQSMATNLQRKFARGCNYNMKIVIRGDRNTGKSCLLARLQGKPFQDEYIPTEEIQAASINWSYKNTEDIVKVDVWDVVDVAKKRKKLEGLKMVEGEEADTPGLDAEFIDVYKGTHGAILVLDITKPWTFEYVKKEYEKVPCHIPVLILANFADLGHHRQVTRQQVAGFVENLVREGPEAAEVRWSEASLRNGFGLKFLHNFFNVPFLILQRQSLIQQLDINQRDIIATQEELDLYMDSDDASYEKFSENLTKKRRQTAEQAAPTPTASIVVGQLSNAVNTPKSTSNFTGADSSLSFSNRPSVPPPQQAAATRIPSPSAKTSQPAVQSKNTEVGKVSSKQAGSKESSPVGGGKVGKVDVDNFVPDSGDFDTFLDEEISQSRNNHVLSNQNIDSSDDEDSGNPMVAKFQDEIEEDDYENDTITALTADIQADSSSDEEQMNNPFPSAKNTAKSEGHDISRGTVNSITSFEDEDEDLHRKNKTNDIGEVGKMDVLDDFYNDCNKANESFHTAYESF